MLWALTYPHNLVGNQKWSLLRPHPLGDPQNLIQKYPWTWHIYCGSPPQMKPKAKKMTTATSLEISSLTLYIPHCPFLLCSFSPSFICVLEVICPSLIVLVVSIIIFSIIFPTWLPLLKLSYSLLCPLPNTGNPLAYGPLMLLPSAGCSWGLVSRSWAVSGPPRPLSGHLMEAQLRQPCPEILDQQRNPSNIFE